MIKVVSKIFSQRNFVISLFVCCAVEIVPIHSISIEMSLLVLVVPRLDFSISKDEIANASSYQNSEDDPENRSEREKK